MAVMVRVTEGTSPGGCSSVIGSVLMVAEGNSVDRYHFSLSTSSSLKLSLVAAWVMVTESGAPRSESSCVQPG